MFPKSPIPRVFPKVTFRRILNESLHFIGLSDVIVIACPANGLRAVRRDGNLLPTGPVLLG